MKTKNNVQQAILKSIAVVFSLVVISITVNAQDFWKRVYENNGFKEVAMVMTEVNTETTSETNDTETFSAFLEVESEEALEVENWMTNENTFTTANFYAVEAESPLNVETWMTNDNYFHNSTFQFIEASDDELEIEDWMLNDDLFSTTNNDEQSLILEDWMISEDVWNI